MKVRADPGRPDFLLKTRGCVCVHLDANGKLFVFVNTCYRYMSLVAKKTQVGVAHAQGFWSLVCQ